MNYRIVSYFSDHTEAQSPPTSLAEAEEIFLEITGKEELGEFSRPDSCSWRHRLNDDETVELRPEKEMINVEDIVDEFTDEQFELAYRRAVEEFGGIIADPDNEDFVTEFTNQLKTLAAAELIKRATKNVKKGIEDA